MKVTVCFGSVRVVVPCGSGELLVSDLTEKAITRYKKAIGKGNEYWVAVHNLKSSNDGGILDPDDQLTDVADDREQIIALYEEQDGAPPHNGGDGTSASSVGTASPDIFHGGEINANIKGFHSMQNGGSKNDVIITQSDLSSGGLTGSGLIVRRGSEPTLVNIGKSVDSPQTHKRWSVMPTGKDAKRDSGDDSDDEDDDRPGSRRQRIGGNGQEKSAFTRFARDSGRQSLASNNSNMQRWFEAQERQEEQYYEQMQADRKEPLGSSGTTEDEQDAFGQEEPKEKPEGRIVVMKNTGGPLGIHVVPDFDENGREMGLVVQGIEPGGKIYRDGRLKNMDRIVEINNISLVDVEFQKAQNIFKEALQTDEIQLRVMKSKVPPPLPKQPPPTQPKSAIKQRPENLNLSEVNSTSEKPIEAVPAKTPEPVTPTKKPPPAVPARHPSTSLSSPSRDKPRYVAPTNTRKIGKKINIMLTKGPEGLGFSITTRDNPAGGHCPIYIKNILPKGAAIRDGQLKSGDRLLEVNNEEMTGKTQSEAVGILRNTKLGSVVSLVVSRQVLEEEKGVTSKETDSTVTMSTFKPPPDVSDVAVLKTKANAPSINIPGGQGDATPSNLSPSALDNLPDEPRTPVTKNKDIMTFDIPLNDTGSAGLGVSVKGKTTTTEQGAQDLGIFIKSVIVGGAASKDSRLRINDQLVEVNGESLVGKSNAEAMEILRKAMQKEGPKSGYIHLMIARRKALPAPVSVQPISQELRVSHTDLPDMSELKPPAYFKMPDIPSSEASQGVRIDLPSGGNTMDYVQPPKFGNSAVDRLRESASIRNTSYMKATHESMLNDTTDSVLSSGANGATLGASTTKTGQTVMIEGDDYQVVMRQSQNQKPRPASTLGFQSSDPEAPHALTVFRSNDNLLEDGTPNVPSWLAQWDKNADVDHDETSPDIGSGDTFRREGFGRQSMSEKRKGHLDPKVSEFYQQIKRNKDGNYQSATWDRRRSSSCRVEANRNSTQLRRVSSVESILQQSHVTEYLIDSKRESEVGPTLGLKKSSSLESLQTAVQDVTENEGNGFWKPPNRGMVRGRGCNDSFRAAVDRSYDDGPGVEAEAMDTLEEESSESGSIQGQRSTRSSISGSDQSEVAKQAAKKKSKEKKDKDKDKEMKEKDRSSGLFKGLGHMFRFGRHRKPVDEKQLAVMSKPGEQPPKTSEGPGATKQVEASKKAREEHERLAEQYRRLQEQRIAEQMRAHEEQRSMSPAGSPSRNERIQQLRAEHQRKHRERQGQYPMEAKEEQYEKQIQELERKDPPGYYPFDLRPEFYEKSLRNHEQKLLTNKLAERDSRFDVSAPRGTSSPLYDIADPPLCPPSYEETQRLGLSSMHRTLGDGATMPSPEQTLQRSRTVSRGSQTCLYEEIGDLQVQSSSNRSKQPSRTEQDSIVDSPSLDFREIEKDCESSSSRSSGKNDRFVPIPLMRQYVRETAVPPDDVNALYAVVRKPKKRTQNLERRSHMGSMDNLNQEYRSHSADSYLGDERNYDANPPVRSGTWGGHYAKRQSSDQIHMDYNEVVAEIKYRSQAEQNRSQVRSSSHPRSSSDRRSNLVAFTDDALPVLLDHYPKPSSRDTKNLVAIEGTFLDDSRLLAAAQRYPHEHAMLPPRRRPEDSYDRPQSRVGYVDPAQLSHYQNLQEIQAQLQRQEYYQKRYQEYMAQQRYHAHSGSDPITAQQFSDARTDSRAHLPAYPRHYSQSDLAWSHHQAALPPRSVTPAAMPLTASMPMPGSLSASQIHPRSQTPVNQLGYPSQHSTAPLGASQHGVPTSSHSASNIGQFSASHHASMGSMQGVPVKAQFSASHHGGSSSSHRGVQSSAQMSASLRGLPSNAQLSASQHGKASHGMAALPSSQHAPHGYGQYREYGDRRPPFAEPNYGSLGRRPPRDRSAQGMMSGPAQV